MELRTSVKKDIITLKIGFPLIISTLKASGRIVFNLKAISDDRMEYLWNSLAAEPLSIEGVKFNSE